jgi:hypothetical protein
MSAKLSLPRMKLLDRVEGAFARLQKTYMRSLDRVQAREEVLPGFGLLLREYSVVNSQVAAANRKARIIEIPAHPFTF